MSVKAILTSEVAFRTNQLQSEHFASFRTLSTSGSVDLSCMSELSFPSQLEFPSPPTSECSFDTTTTDTTFFAASSNPSLVEPANVLSTSDVFSLTSRLEGTPRTEIGHGSKTCRRRYIEDYVATRDESILRMVEDDISDYWRALSPCGHYDRTTSTVGCGHQVCRRCHTIRITFYNDSQRQAYVCGLCSVLFHFETSNMFAKHDDDLLERIQSTARRILCPAFRRALRKSDPRHGDHVKGDGPTQEVNQLFGTFFRAYTTNLELMKEDNTLGFKYHLIAENENIQRMVLEDMAVLQQFWQNLPCEAYSVSVSSPAMKIVVGLRAWALKSVRSLPSVVSIACGTREWHYACVVSPHFVAYTGYCRRQIELRAVVVPPRHTSTRTTRRRTWRPLWHGGIPWRRGERTFGYARRYVKHLHSIGKLRSTLIQIRLWHSEAGREDPKILVVMRNFARQLTKKFVRFDNYLVDAHVSNKTMIPLSSGIKVACHNTFSSLVVEDKPGEDWAVGMPEKKSRRADLLVCGVAKYKLGKPKSWHTSLQEIYHHEEWHFRTVDGKIDNKRNGFLFEYDERNGVGTVTVDGRTTRYQNHHVNKAHFATMLFKKYSDVQTPDNDADEVDDEVDIDSAYKNQPKAKSKKTAVVKSVDTSAVENVDGVDGAVEGATQEEFRESDFTLKHVKSCKSEQEDNSTYHVIEQGLEDKKMVDAAVTVTGDVSIQTDVDDSTDLLFDNLYKFEFSKHCALIFRYMHASKTSADCSETPDTPEIFGTFMAPHKPWWSKVSQQYQALGFIDPPLWQVFRTCDDMKVDVLDSDSQRVYVLGKGKRYFVAIENAGTHVSLITHGRFRALIDLVNCAPRDLEAKYDPVEFDAWHNAPTGYTTCAGVWYDALTHRFSNRHYECCAEVRRHAPELWKHPYAASVGFFKALGIQHFGLVDEISKCCCGDKDPTKYVTMEPTVSTRFRILRKTTWRLSYCSLPEELVRICFTTAISAKTEEAAVDLMLSQYVFRSSQAFTAYSVASGDERKRKELEYLQFPKIDELQYTAARHLYFYFKSRFPTDANNANRVAEIHFATAIAGPMIESARPKVIGIPVVTGSNVTTSGRTCGHISRKKGYCQACWNSISCDVGHFLVRTLVPGTPGKTRLSTCGICDEPDRYIADLKRHLTISQIGVVSARCYATEVKPFTMYATPALKSDKQDAGTFWTDIGFREDAHQRGATLLGIAFPVNVPVVSHMSSETMRASMMSRQLRENPKPKMDRVQKLYKYAFAMLERIVRGRHVTPWTFEKWVRRFPGSSQRAYRLARERMLRQGFTKVSHKRKCFMKYELLTKNLRDHGCRYAYAARIICALKNLEPTTELGPWITAAQELLKEDWNGKTCAHCSCGCRTVFCSGMNAERLGQEFQAMHEFPFHWDGDFNKYDSTLELHLLRIEEYFYELLGLRNFRNAWETYQAQKNTAAGIYVKGTKVAQASWVGRRNSGDPNTTLGNTVINGVVWNFVLHLAGHRGFRLDVNGDDVQCGLWEAFDCEKLSATIKDLGLSIEMNRRDSPYTLQFNGAMGFPARSADGTMLIIAGPQPRRFLPKIGWSLESQPNSKAWLRGVALGWRNIVAHIPMYNVIVDKYLSLTVGVKAAKIKPDSNFLYMQTAKPSVAYWCDTERYTDMMQALHDSGYGGIASNKNLKGLYMEYIDLVSGLESLPAMVNCAWVTKILY